MLGSSYSKANKGWLAGATHRQKKASFKSKQVNQPASGGSRLRRVSELETTGHKVMVAAMMSQRSCIGWTPSFGFFPGSREVFYDY